MLETASVTLNSQSWSIENVDVQVFGVILEKIGDGSTSRNWPFDPACCWRVQALGAT